MVPDALTRDTTNGGDELDARCSHWIKQMSLGDELALNAFYDATLHRVFAVAIRIVRDAALAEDVVTDVYHEAWKNAGRYIRERGRPITWLLTICRNRALDEYRRESSIVRKKEAAAAMEVPATVERPDMLLQAVEEGSAVRNMLEQISAEDRQLIALAYFKGLSHQQIAEYTDMPLGTVKSRIRRALTTLSAAIPAELREY